jgi:hypothetical protein
MVCYVVLHPVSEQACYGVLGTWDRYPLVNLGPTLVSPLLCFPLGGKTLALLFGAVSAGIYADDAS